MNMGLRAVLSLVLGLTVAATVASAEEFLVGVELPLTGPMARAGAGVQEGIMVATDIFNKRNGKHKIKIVTIDDESQPAKAVAAVEKLASQGVVAIDGGYGSNLVGPASEAANKAGLVFISSGATDQALTNRGLKHFFRISPASGYAKAMNGLLSDMAPKAISVVYSTKEATTHLAKEVEKAMSAKGVKVTMHPFDPAITDFKPIINKVKLQDKPDVLVAVGYENDYVGIIRAAKVLKPEVKALVAAWSLATPKMAADFPDLTPNVYGTAMLGHPTEFKTPEGKEFGETYKKLYNKEPDYLGQFGYVQSMVLFEAIARAADNGALKKGGLADELRKTKRDTLMGPVQFDANGDNPVFLQRMAQHQQGKVVLVWPKEQASGKMNYPAVPW